MRLAIVCSGALLLLTGCRPKAPSPKEAPEFIPEPVKLQDQVPGEDHWRVSRKPRIVDGKVEITISDGKVLVQCGDKTEVFLRPQLVHTDMLKVVPEDQAQQIGYRLDDSPEKKEQWHVGDDYQQFLVPDKTLRDVLSAKKLVLNYQTDAGRRTDTFTLTALKVTMEKAGCGSV